MSQGNFIYLPGINLLQVRKSQPGFEQLYNYAKQRSDAKIEEHYVIVSIDTTLDYLLKQNQIYNELCNHLMLIDKEDEV